MSPEPFSNAVLTWIIVGALIFFLMTLWMIAKWAVSQILKKIDVGATRLDAIAIVVSDLSGSVKELTTEIMVVRQKQEADDADKIRHQLHTEKEIDLLRDSRHILLAYIQALRNVIESKLGWRFEGIWALPKMNRDPEDRLANVYDPTGKPRDSN